MSANPPQPFALAHGAAGAHRTGRRAAPRVRLGIPAKVMLLQGLEKCVLEDLSQTGARLMLSGTRPRLGAGAVLEVQGTSAFGAVIWVLADRIGLQFDEALPLDEVVAIRHYADAFAEHEAAISSRNARDFVQGRPRLRTPR
jgi:hypothetical protein